MISATTFAADLEAYEPNEYLPAIAMQFCQNIFDSHALDLHLRNAGSLDYTTVETPVAIHRVTSIFLRDSLNHYLSATSYLCVVFLEAHMTGFPTCSSTTGS